MERITEEQLMSHNLSQEDKASIKNVLHPHSHTPQILMYNHNGADVAITKTSREGAIHHNVLIVKDKKFLHFRISGGIGNSVGTLFVRATVSGLDTREASGDSKKGMYPYKIVTHSEQQEKGTDLLTHATQIYERYQAETKGQIKIGDIFKSHVPGTFQSIKENLDLIDKQKQDRATQIAIDARMQEFKNKMSGF